MQQEPKISIIVPVYNTEKYLHRCIDSIIAQTFTDWECLLIDDGSTDESPNICDEYAKRDSRIKVFHTENDGVASARQLGTDNAKGTYSIHVDSDDWIETNMLEDMYDKAIKADADIVISDYFVDENNSPGRMNHNYLNDQCSALEVCKAIISNKMIGTLWNKLIRHNLYKKYKVSYIRGINYCEDVLILVQILLHPVKIVFLREAFYYYNKENPASITTNYTKETFEGRIKYIQELRKRLPLKEFKQECNDAEFCVKMEALYFGIIKIEDFGKIMPSSIYTILRANLTLKRKLLYSFYSIKG
jgi:glycosyltransferase involved in cell wall biosynthesis